MKKNIWILNHYATDMFFDEGGRHYWLGKELIKRGYRVTVFCANTIHKSEQIVQINDGLFAEEEKEGLHFVFVKTNGYQGNGISRVKNMLAYTRNMLRLYKKYANTNGEPDVIYASSVHPLAWYVGIKTARHFRVKCICEIRDMWPLTLIEFGRIKETSMMARILLRFERWAYEKADALIFTMEGGKQYIEEKQWDLSHGGKVDVRKVYYINNGIDLAAFLENRENYRIEDEDLENEDIFKVVYTGTLGQANRIDLLLEAAKSVQQKGLPIKFLVWGDGDKRNELQEQVTQEKITNVVFKGRVPKKYVPSIASRSDLNISVLEECGLYKYGLSLNKMFDYMAAQRPFIIAGAYCKCRILEENPYCTICETSDAKKIAEAVAKAYNQSRTKPEIPLQDMDTLMNMCDFSRRADELVKVLENVR